MPITNAEPTDDLKVHWAICLALASCLAAYNVVCHVWLENNRLMLDEPQRVMIRSIFYLLTIALFPLTKLVRHILLRLNQTMPGEDRSDSRYLKTIVVTQSLIEIVALFGPIMFYLGDDYNTLYIFTMLGALGLFLHRPQIDEYLAIVRFRATDERWRE